MDPHLDGESAVATRLVRPYMVTKGRTEADLPIEAMVQRRTLSTEGLLAEARRVIEVAVTPLAVAEIAVAIDQPIGIARVLIADLVQSGHVETYDTATTDDEVIVRRILHAMRK